MGPGRRHQTVQRSHQTLLLFCLFVLRPVVLRPRSNSTEDGQQPKDTPILRLIALHTLPNLIFIIHCSAGTTGTRTYLCSPALIITIISVNMSLVCSSLNGILILSHNTLLTLWRHTTLNGLLHFSAKVASHYSGLVVYVSISSTCGFILRDTIAGDSGGVVTSVPVSNNNVSTSCAGPGTNSRGRWKRFEHPSGSSYLAHRHIGHLLPLL